MDDRRYFLLKPDLSERLIEDFKRAMEPIKEKKDQFLSDMEASFFMQNQFSGVIVSFTYPADKELPHYLRKDGYTRYNNKRYVEAAPNRRYKEGKKLQADLTMLNNEIRKVGTSSTYICERLGMYREVIDGSIRVSTAGRAYDNGPIVLTVPIGEGETLEDFTQKGVKEIKHYQFVGIGSKELSPEEVWHDD